MELKYDITPLGMLNNAKIWYVLYRQNINLDVNHKVVAVYCLLIGLEMLLKSYLIFLNKEKYSYESRLKELGHELGDVSKALREEKEAKFVDLINKIFLKYELSSIDVNDLRYPKKGDRVILFGEYFKPNNEFDDLFNNITEEVQKGIVDYFYKTKKD